MGRKSLAVIPNSIIILLSIALLPGVWSCAQPKTSF